MLSKKNPFALEIPEFSDAQSLELITSKNYRKGSIKKDKEE
ncbi:hypothetical protein [Chryseobacterium terrae]|uniref:Uncharacterized protein n=1 Tax=Chryseobacterium terrae TaxID=3163299 RepID=A0ABW8Y0N4_9FLAO